MRTAKHPLTAAVLFAVLPVFFTHPTCGTAAGANLVAVSELGLRVARGFRVSLYADANLAPDVYAMTVNPRGNLVITSQGYVRTLLDRDGNGQADDAIDFAETRTGGMGLAFDGNDLLLMADDGLWRLNDRNADGRADGPAQRLYTFASSEHGGHAIRRGPDGRWYAIAGNENKFDDARLTLPSEAGHKIEGGALLRFSADFRDVEALAQGFRNPYDFDFDSEGELFTYDSDCEGDYFLPWYEPTRIYHVAPFQHHGWRLGGWTRSWPRPDYYTDTVGILQEVGRGSPTGVTVYRHTQFPNYYRDSLFALDWTFGKVYFLPLTPEGASYRAPLELFLESTGTEGFAPTDCVVGPDGSLFVSTGGRKTRGGVYRIEYVAEPALSALATNWIVLAGSERNAVLNAPQPLEAWSRGWWSPVAVQLGPDPFIEAATDNRLTVAQRVRAIEVLTELHGGLPTATASICAQAASPEIRARIGWSLDAEPCDNFGPILLGLARDTIASVPVHALNALRRHAGDLNLQMLQQALAANLAHPEKRVRLAAAALASELPEPAWKALWAQQQQSGVPQAKLTTTVAALWRGSPSEVNTSAVESALAVLRQNKAPDVQLDATRLALLGLGDYHLHDPSVEAFTGYEPALELDAKSPLESKIRQVATPLFPTHNPTTDRELARLLAFVEADDLALPGKLTSFFTERSSAAEDFHCLAVLARITSPSITNFPAKIGATIASLDRKLDSQGSRPRQNWTPRLTEVVEVLLKRDPRIADAILRSPDFPRAGNLALVPLLGSDRYLAAARLFYEAVQRNSNFPWSAALIDVLAALPNDEAQPLFRRQWVNVALRDRLVPELARKPLVGDRDKFVTALTSIQPSVVREAMSALLKLPPDNSRNAVVATLKALRRAVNDPREQALRAQALALLNQQTGQTFAVTEAEGELMQRYQPVFTTCESRYPGVLKQLDAQDDENPAAWNQFYKNVPWTKGDASRGADIFTARGCQTCHALSQAIAPDLAGAASRMSPVELFDAIVFPGRNIAPAYRMTTFQMRDGSTLTGLVAFESADGVIVRTGAASTQRLAEADIRSRHLSELSFMPTGLLRGLVPQEFADLHAYLKTLQPLR